ncbi:protein bunched, class 2/F/G isoform, partial [Aplysia californica]|uniref:Protein bunched, class 2/F/G isoform n=1 Tax=Aplysia californica TaxID=6500 RepID=A0ABM1A116_APLCA
MENVQQSEASANPADQLRGQGLNTVPKVDTLQAVNEESSNLSPSKSADPARKKTFKIISVKKGGSGDLPVDNDADSVDGLDESQTEDLSSELYDTSSKATDVDMDLQDNMMPLTPDDVTSTTTIVVKQKPDRESQSRFKVVKIETKEPFRRGKWVCYDFFDTAPAAVVTLEKNGSKVTEDSIIPALSGNLSSSSSVHYVHGVNESSSNIFVTPVALSPPVVDSSQPILSEVFVPIQPAPSSQVLSQLDGVSSEGMVPGVSTEVMAPLLAHQIRMSYNRAVSSSSTSFETLAQPVQTNIVQSLPQSNLFPYAQNGPATSLYQNGVQTGQTTQIIAVPNSTLIAAAGGAQGVIPSSVSADFKSAVQDNMSSAQNQGFIVVGGVPIPRSQSQSHVGGNLPPSGGDPSATSQQVGTGSVLPSAGSDIMTSSTGNLGIGDQALSGVAMDESTGSIKTLQADGEAPQDLEEAVETMYNMGLQEGNEENVDESGGSTVAIDNKIEQAMDLVKRHLMYAVREEVEILKQQIGEMVERITQLEYENSVLKSEAKPETLNKLVVPRQVTQVTGQPPSATGVVQQLSGVVGGPLSTATPAPSAGGMGVGVVAGSTSVPAQPQQQPQQQ